MNSLERHNLTLYASKTQVELLIAICRVGIALFALAKLVSTSGTLDAYIRIGFFAYSVTLLVALLWQDHGRYQYNSITTAVDFFIMCALLVGTENTDILANILAIFIMTSSVSRWPQSSLVTLSCTLILVQTAALLWHNQWHFLTVLQSDTFITSSGNVIVTGLILWYIRYIIHQSNTVSNLLAQWPENTFDDFQFEAVIAQIATTFDTNRLLVIWEDAEEPWRHFIYFNDGNLITKREPPTCYEPLVADKLKERHFLCTNTKSANTTLADINGKVMRWKGIPLNQKLSQDYAIHSTLCIRARTGNLQAYLLLIDPPNLSTSALRFGSIIGKKIEDDLRRQQMRVLLEQSIATEERIQLARNLHDGVLQSLTGVALKLQTAMMQWQQDPDAAYRQLRETQEIIVSEQRDLRSVIKQLKPADPTALSNEYVLSVRIEQLARAVMRNWGLEVQLDLMPAIDTIPEPLNHELYRIVQEAFNNATKHSACKNIKLDIIKDDLQVYITIIDDGIGFPFSGVHNLESLQLLEKGPGSICDRVKQCGGEITLYSTDQGTRMAILIPFLEDQSSLTNTLFNQQPATRQYGNTA